MSSLAREDMCSVAQLLFRKICCNRIHSTCDANTRAHLSYVAANVYYRITHLGDLFLQDDMSSLAIHVSSCRRRHVFCCDRELVLPCKKFCCSRIQHICDANTRPYLCYVTAGCMAIVMEQHIQFLLVFARLPSSGQYTATRQSKKER